jgi:hypothetical protein
MKAAPKGEREQFHVWRIGEFVRAALVQRQADAIRPAPRNQQRIHCNGVAFTVRQTRNFLSRI